MKFKLFGIIFDFSEVAYISFLGIWLLSMIGSIVLLVANEFMLAGISAIVCALCMATAESISDKFYASQKDKP